MRRVGFAIAMAAVLGVAAPAAAAEFLINFGSTETIPNNNDFKDELNDLGLDVFASSGATLALSAPGRITFYRLGSESSRTNGFTGGSVTGLEIDGNQFGAPILLGTDTFAAGSLLNKLFFTTGGTGEIANIGSEGFGIFLSANATSGTSTKVVYFGFDDFVNNKDDNHDDFLIKAVVGNVPEPQTWAMMILGFGLVGFAARRSRQASLA
jgi:hypothetical protein